MHISKRENHSNVSRVQKPLPVVNIIIILSSTYDVTRMKNHLSIPYALKHLPSVVIQPRRYFKNLKSCASARGITCTGYVRFKSYMKRKYENWLNRVDVAATRWKMTQTSSNELVCLGQRDDIIRGVLHDTDMDVTGGVGKKSQRTRVKGLNTVIFE